MARVSCLLPDEKLTTLASGLAAKSGLDILEIKHISTSEAVEEARRQQLKGAEIIIARGVQAEKIKRDLQIPVVGIQISALELADLIKQACAIVGDGLHLGILGSSMTQRDEFNMRKHERHYGITISHYNVTEESEYDEVVSRALKNGANVLVGGKMTERAAAKHDCPVIRVSTGEESILEAFHVAAGIAYALELEKSHLGELKTYLDYSPNGTIKIDKNGTICLVNQYMEKLLGIRENQLIGKPLASFFPSITMESLDKVFSTREEIFTSVKIDDELIAVNIIPVVIDGVAQSAMVFLHESSRLRGMQNEIFRETYAREHIAVNTFSSFPNVSKQFDEVLAQARALSNFCETIHLSGEFGTEKYLLAQAIHNAGPLKDRPFVPMLCSGFNSENELDRVIFGDGEPGANFHPLIDAAIGGTLFLDEISRLGDSAQYKLYYLINHQVKVSQFQKKRLRNRVRVITADSHDLSQLVREGRLRVELYYLLRSIRLEVSPLRTRPDDVEAWVDYYMREYTGRYGRYIKLTEGARRVIGEHTWNGGMYEIRSFCRSLVFMSPRRYVDELFAAKMLDHSLKTPQNAPEAERKLVPKAARIAAVLKKHRGNRTASAEELGVSTTTLWRSIKKYGLTEEDWL